MIYTSVVLGTALMHNHPHGHDGSDCCSLTAVGLAPVAGESQQQATTDHDCTCHHATASSGLDPYASEDSASGHSIEESGELRASPSSSHSIHRGCLACSLASESSTPPCSAAISSLYCVITQSTPRQQTSRLSACLRPPVRGPPVRFLYVESTLLSK